MARTETDADEVNSIEMEPLQNRAPEKNEEAEAIPLLLRSQAQNVVTATGTDERDSNAVAVDIVPHVPTSASTSKAILKQARKDHVKLLFIFFCFNILLLILDIGSDVFTAYDFYADGHPNWCIITSCLIMAPFTASLSSNLLLRFIKIFGLAQKEEVEPFANIIWQFPLFHPIKNIRLFMSLACMETQLSVNSSLISKIKGEALPLGLFEAFLEAAPQFIFQLSLALRTGFITKFQVASIIFSLGSLTLSSIRLFYSQRLGRYRDVDPAIGHMFFIVPWIFLQNIGFLTAWIFITAYLQICTIGCVFLVMASVALVLHFSVFGDDVKMQDANSDRVPCSQRQRETSRTFRIAVLTSWVSPCTVWSNNKSPKEKKTGCKISSSKFLIVTALTSALSVMLCLVVGIKLKLESSSDPFSIDNNSPVTHCFKLDNYTGQDCVYYVNQTVLDSQKCIYLCMDRRCKDIIRLCDKNELPTDMMYKIVFPSLFGILALIILSSFALQTFGDYETMFNWTKYLSDKFQVPKWFSWPIVHPTLINERLELKIEAKMAMNGNETLSDDIEKQNIDPVSKANEKCLIKPDPINGSTCLHFAFQKCLFDDVKSMIYLKGNPLQKNNEGESIDSMLQLCSNETIRELMDRVGSDIYYQKRKCSDGKEFTLKINMYYCEQSQLNGKATIQDDKGNFQMTKNLKNPFEVVLAMCLLKETGDRIEHSVKYEKNDEILQTRKIFDNLAQLTFNSESSLHSFHSFYKENPQKRNSELSIDCCCTNILHKMCQENDVHGFYLWNNVLGANLKAKNASNETPFENFIKNLNANGTTDLNKQSPHLLWLAMKNGAASLTKEEEQLEKMLNLLKTKCFLKPGKKIPPNVKKVFFYCASKGDKESLHSFLELKYTVGDFDENKRTALHHAVRGDNLECMEVLLEKGAKVNDIDIYKQAPIHFAAKEGNLNCLKLLIEKNAVINMEGQNRMTPLHFAIQKEHLECVKFLVQAGANVNATDQNKQTPLHIAAKTGKVTILTVLMEESKKLITLRQRQSTAEDKGRRKERKKSKKEGKDQKQQLQGSLPKVNAGDRDKQTPLHLAAKHGFVECVKFLLDHAASTSVTNKNGKTPLEVSTNPECSEAIRAAASSSQ